MITRRFLLAGVAAVAACSSVERSMDASNRERQAAQRQPTSSEPQQIVDKARTVVEEMKTDPSFGNAPDLLRRTRAVVIVPNLIKGGFFVGGEGGQGVMLAHNGTTWSYPGFEQLFSGSFGLQIGLEQARLVMFAMTEKALQGLLENEWKVGAQAGVSILMIGSNVQAGTTPRLDADLIVWAKSQGAYAGLTLEGSVLKPNGANNQAYYGRAVAPADIVLSGAVRNPGADALRQSLALR
jgi:lipid-binding SYLF domain-containing protein